MAYSKYAEADPKLTAAEEQGGHWKTRNVQAMIVKKISKIIALPHFVLL
ncbi:MAG: hypothetical protein IJL89_00205 [Firmicutes bacterium]|nr:hypothetical protein [Bacillota bacterium]